MWIVSLAAVLAGLGGAASGGEVAGLQDTLEKGLRARVPQDFVFIGKVVTMVRNDQLPRKVVLAAYQWVRKNRRDKKYLIPYFQQSLRRLAAEIGVEI